jgi:FlaA1/EpsC-like NDP-sugar epimerase
MNIYKILGRSNEIFDKDYQENFSKFLEIFHSSRILVVGAAGSIGKMVSKKLISYNPSALHLIDISENNLVELIRDLRSSNFLIQTDLLALPLDVSSLIFDKFIESQCEYDFIFNFCALKHVRSEKDPFTLMRMIETNVINSLKLQKLAELQGAKKYFVVSTDKAANPTNLMGATKRIMEKAIFGTEHRTPCSMARFANVAFSDGSLLCGYINRIQKHQPLVAPKNLQRYFMTDVEASLLCIFSSALGGDREIFFPKAIKEMVASNFLDIATRFLNVYGYEPYICDSENEAKARQIELNQNNKWPIYLFDSDTTGEKTLEEFYTSEEVVDFNRFQDIGVIKHAISILDNELVDNFVHEYQNFLYGTKPLLKTLLTEICVNALPELNHVEKLKYLDDVM